MIKSLCLKYMINLKIRSACKKRGINIEIIKYKGNDGKVRIKWKNRKD